MPDARTMLIADLEEFADGHRLPPRDPGGRAGVTTLRHPLASPAVVRSLRLRGTRSQRSPGRQATPARILKQPDRLAITPIEEVWEMRALLGAVVALMLVAGTPFLADAGAAEDTMITTKVKTKLTTERVKNLVSVNVDTKDGVVHLKGTVPNEQAKADAERLAKDTDGVVSVTNDIKVSPPKK